VWVRCPGGVDGVYCYRAFLIIHVNGAFPSFVVPPLGGAARHERVRVSLTRHDCAMRPRARASGRAMRDTQQQPMSFFSTSLPPADYPAATSSHPSSPQTTSRPPAHSRSTTLSLPRSRARRARNQEAHVVDRLSASAMPTTHPSYFVRGERQWTDEGLLCPDDGSRR
jgi:hypothetical protein